MLTQKLEESLRKNKHSTWLSYEAGMKLLSDVKKIMNKRDWIKYVDFFLEDAEQNFTDMFETDEEIYALYEPTPVMHTQAVIAEVAYFGEDPVVKFDDLAFKVKTSVSMGDMQLEDVAIEYVDALGFNPLTVSRMDSNKILMTFAKGEDGAVQIIPGDAKPTGRSCLRCGSTVNYEPNDEKYPYICIPCDQNMFENETKLDTEAVPAAQAESIYAEVKRVCPEFLDEVGLVELMVDNEEQHRVTVELPNRMIAISTVNPDREFKTMVVLAGELDLMSAIRFAEDRMSSVEDEFDGNPDGYKTYLIGQIVYDLMLGRENTHQFIDSFNKNRVLEWDEQ